MAQRERNSAEKTERSPSDASSSAETASGSAAIAAPAFSVSVAIRTRAAERTLIAEASVEVALMSSRWRRPTSESHLWYVTVMWTVM